MSELNRAVFLKQSGELLELPESQGHWGKAAKVAEGIAEAYAAREELDVYGLTIVTGAGNLARGATLKEQRIADEYADVIGRWGTLGNAIVLSGALKSLDLPVRTIIAANMGYKDPSLGGEMERYSPQAVADAHARGEVVVIAGGTGRDGVTTDDAVVFYANDYREVSQEDETEIVVLKSTKFDGVFTFDPAMANGKVPDRYKVISARTIKAEGLGVIDADSVDKLINNSLSMVIYSDAEHSLKEALDPRAAIGTLVVPQMCEPVFA